MAGAAKLQHPTIIPLIEVGSVTMDNGRPVPFYVMPYAPGESVRSRLLYEGPFSISATVRLLRDVLGALEHAHGVGLVHRDIKPENIYLSGSHAVLADFGIAKAVERQRGENAITNPGETVGTPAYMASEQLAGDPNTDHRADIYSVGVVAYELLAGRIPWRGNHRRSVWRHRCVARCSHSRTSATIFPSSWSPRSNGIWHTRRTIG